ncbi:MAG: hypothetical protein WD355_02695, partial [Balneolaceae bacterium]
PSEEVIFEKKMLDDQNLLIEVECFRNIHKRLNDLPEVEPPAEVTEKVLEAASRHLERESGPGQLKYLWLSAAATLLITLFGGMFLLDQQGGSTGEASEASTTAGGGVLISGSEMQSGASEANPEPVSPWVDNNDLLHFEQRYDVNHASAFDSIFRHSYQKLESVQAGARDFRPADTAPGQFRDLHLTGSGN